MEAPLVRDGKIVDYYGWRVDERAFPLDMAAFAVNVGYFVQQSGHNTIGFPSIKGFQETGFLSMLNMSSFRDVEPLAPKGVSNRVRTKNKGENITLPYCSCIADIRDAYKER